MKILFWNLKRNNIASYIIDVLEELNIDILICAEFQGLDLKELLKSIPFFRIADTKGACEKVILLHRDNIQVVCSQAQSRYAIFTCQCNESVFHICALHLQDKSHSSYHDRAITIGQIIPDIDKVEKDTKISRTMIIGDFNVSPFDDEMSAKELFNAVMFKELIEKTEYVTSNKKRFRFII